MTELGEWLTGEDPARAATARRHLQEVADTDIPRVASTARTLLDTEPTAEPPAPDPQAREEAAGRPGAADRLTELDPAAGDAQPTGDQPRANGARHWPHRAPRARAARITQAAGHGQKPVRPGHQPHPRTQSQPGITPARPHPHRPQGLAQD